jgi:uncharacterized RDD family membrane protein YckC
VTDTPPSQPPGWYHAQGDPPGTQRYWDGSQWQGGPQPAPGPGSAPGAARTTGTQVAGDLATPGARFGARIIDLLIWIVISVVFGVLVGGGSTTVGTESSVRSWFAGLLSTLAVMAYEVWFNANRGGTPGKLAVGLRVARADNRAVPVDYQTALLRVAPIALGVIPILGGFLGFVIAVASLFMIFTDSLRQTVWDKLAKTVVVRA